MEQTNNKVYNKKTGSECICINNETGFAEFTRYPLFPGIELIYNNIQMEYFDLETERGENVLEINHCRGGRNECCFGGQSYCYMGTGDISICSLKKNPHQHYFPTSRYLGMTVLVDFTNVPEEIERIFTLMSIDLPRIMTSSENLDFYLMHSTQTLQHAFLELYSVQEAFDPGYLKVKLLDLLLVLTDLDLNPSRHDHPYFSRPQVDGVKAVRRFLAEHLDTEYTPEQLAGMFQLPPGILATCFKNVFGISIPAWLHSVRLQRAYSLLRETQLPVEEIAAQVAFPNLERFNAAFKEKYDMRPETCRRQAQKAK